MTSKRKNTRARVLLTATITLNGRPIDARVRDISEQGARMESNSPPAINSVVVFTRGQTGVDARVAWVEGKLFGLEFIETVNPRDILPQVPQPAPLAPPQPYRRPSFYPTRLQPDEQQLVEELRKAGLVVPTSR